MPSALRSLIISLGFTLLILNQILSKEYLVILAPALQFEDLNSRLITNSRSFHTSNPRLQSQ
jgi:hypothetical protein